MSRLWYLSQNEDVAISQMNPLWHYLKYGRKELRTWREPLWFKKAFSKTGWVWNEIPKISSDATFLNQPTKNNCQKIAIHRIGNYSEYINALKVDELKS